MCHFYEVGISPKGVTHTPHINSSKIGSAWHLHDMETHKTEHWIL